MNPRVTFLGSQDRELREWLTNNPDGHERAALVLFRRLARVVNNQPRSDRFLAVEIIKMTDEWILESSKTHVKFNMRLLPAIYFACEERNLELGFVHSHPDGYMEFSEQDDRNEGALLHGLCGCLTDEAFLVALILVEGKWKARVRQGNTRNTAIPVRHVSVLSDKIELHGLANEEMPTPSLLRQEAAFGKPFNKILQSLRVAVVGVGGTGSSVATLLARAGVGELILIDGDKLEESNMNRVRGYSFEHLDSPKAESLRDFINGIGLNVSVSAISHYVNESAEALDALSSADIIFGCTDDQAGRDILNQALYYHAQVLIDLGLTGFIQNDEEDQPFLKDHRGRISCILPESGACLRCQNVVTDKRLEFEQAIKDRPELKDLDAETLEREYYLVGGGVRAPGVGPFTSATADFGVATLMDLIRQFRRIPSDLRKDNIWIDFVHLGIHSNDPQNNNDCIYCRKGFLLLKDEKSYRLEMPRFGKIRA